MHEESFVTQLYLIIYILGRSAGGANHGLFKGGQVDLYQSGMHTALVHDLFTHKCPESGLLPI